MRFLCKVPSSNELPTFFVTTALQRKLICRSASVGGAAGIRALPWRTTAAGRCPPMVRLVDYFRSFRFGLS